MAQFHLVFVFLCYAAVAVHGSATFTLINKCQNTVWPGILSGAGSPPLSTTGFALEVGESKTIQAPASWGGRLWGRTHCSEDSTGKFTCLTGDCGSGKMECVGGNAAPPATLAEFKLDGDGGMDFYDVSLVDGYNLPMLVVPQGGTGDRCTYTGCVVDLNGACPSELRVTSSGGDGGGNVACKSACEAFGDDKYCCSGAYSNPDTCKPSQYSELFKNACPRAYSYAYDDKTSTFTCVDADYIITFCPSPNTSQKSSSGTQNTPASDNDNSSAALINGTMVYEGAELDQSSAASGTCLHVMRTQGFASAAAVAIVAAMWLLCQHF
ncbi:OLC1v1018285C1 [Oldenlandia corymbosa var. corymbosa]|uniref:OLC1v1018285C1 n=1 Tax=Oldenlandia corymbosa var. corymbosa TaxID=529605 RepID=A0AAV1EBG5_OLDCO|nr:OLC1v1018285C1 [Oldenlandia corymbosa var. corymbosa]